MKLSHLHSLLAALSLIPPLVTSTTTEASLRVCYDYTIPVNATNLALKAGYKPFKSNFDVANFIGILAGRTSTSLNLIIGQENRTAIYNISATICSLRNRNKKQNTILLASHGLGYDRRSVPAPECNSIRSTLTLTSVQILGLFIRSGEIQFC